MFKLGNTFGARTKPQAEMIQPDCTATLKGCQLGLGRANKAYETKTAELTAARAKLAQLEQALGEKVADGEDTGPSIQAVQAVTLTITQLDHAVSVLRQRQQDAATSLKIAEQAAAIEGEVNALAAFKAEAVQATAVLVELERCATRLAQAAVVVAAGRSHHANFLLDARLEFERFIGISSFPFTGRGAVPSKLMRYKKFSEVAPDPESVKSRRRP